MTANVKVEIAKRTNVLRIPSAALRFRPTPEVFAALNQEVPKEAQQFAGGRSGGRGSRSAQGSQGSPGSQSSPQAAPGSSASASTPSPAPSAGGSQPPVQ